MNKKNAEYLLNDTFNQDFDLNRFLRFIKELFNHFNENIRDVNFRNEYQDYVENVTSLGLFPDPNRKLIEVFTIKLKNNSSIGRARTMQRNLIASLLRGKIGIKGRDAALVAFYGDDTTDWRFSFVKMEYEFVGESLDTREKLTQARRYSFLVGQNEPNYTCKKQFLKLIKQEEFKPSLEEIEEAFNIEKVTQEFFDEYYELFKKLRNSLKGIINKDSKVKKEFEDKKISKSDFAKKLMGQIVFIYFLQKKGWLGVEKGKTWGTGPRDFIRSLFDKKIVNYENFYDDILEPLFYEALSGRDRDNFYYSRFNCRIPFLNGGLFDTINGYDWVETNITIDDKIFFDIFETFDTYNFTVKEDEPLDKEVAIDPEMLGRVFENLLEVEDRKLKGAFYTPREVVHYMCQKSLINYLDTNLDIPKEDIEHFILLADSTLDSVIRVQEQIKKYKKAYDEYNLPEAIKENIQEIDELLKNVKIVDPAVGSGAFPVGMMNEIVKIRSIFALINNQKISHYNLKKETIKNSLYGVDIDSSAVDITKLRFWLSLIVDETNIENIKPLPNLDHIIMCGNSLLEEFEGNKLFNEKLVSVGQKYPIKVQQLDKEVNELKGRIKNEQDKIIAEKLENDLKKKKKQMKNLIKYNSEKRQQSQLYEEESQKKLRKLAELPNKYFEQEGKALKKEYIEELQKIEWEYIEESLKEQGNEESIERLDNYKKNNSKPFFIWKLYFFDVFQRENPGFDIVIANPPYKSNKGVSSELKATYKRNFGISDDLYNYFFLKSFEVVRTNGVVTFISSNTYFTINSKINLRELFLNNRIIEIFNVGNVFEVPMVDTAINITKKENMENSDYRFIFKDGRDSFINPKIYRASIDLYRNALNKVIFPPSSLNLQIYKNYNEKIKKLHEEWWKYISTSKNITKNHEKINDYQKTLKYCNLTLMGLITEGGQGLATADNGRFLGVIENSKEAEKILEKRPQKLFEAIIKNNIDELKELRSLDDVSNYLNEKNEEEIIDLFDTLKSKYGRDIFGKGYLFRIIPQNKLSNVYNLNEEEKTNGINFNKPYYVPYDKGDKDGNRWYLKTPFCIDWSENSVKWLKNNSGKKGTGMPVVRNPQFYFKEGFCWILTLNEFSKYQKARLKDPGVFDVNAMTLIPVFEKVNSKYLICLLNSYFIYHFKFNFINNTSAFQINDARKLPILIPSKKQLEDFENIFDRAYSIKIDYFDTKISKSKAKEKLNLIQKELDSIVYELYGIENVYDN